MVEAVGKPRLLSFIIGLVAVFLAVGFILYLYIYFSILANQGPGIIVNPNEIPRLFLFISGILFLGIYGGYEIGRFIGATNRKKANLKSQTRTSGT